MHMILTEILKEEKKSLLKDDVHLKVTEAEFICCCFILFDMEEMMAPSSTYAEGQCLMILI